jgi:tetratricopeptide (TPR) repeat protein
MAFDTFRRLARPSRDWLTAVALAGVTVVAFLPALRCEFVNFDDTDYVTRNAHVTAGLTPAGAVWAFTTFGQSNWHPLTWLSLQLDASLYWPNAWGFHLTNVLVHAASAALLFLALRVLTGAFWRSAAAALLFAVHPLRVESVAWVSERKDVLSVFFGMAALLAYAGYARRPSTLRYGAVVAAFALSLLCKPMLVTLPCLLLVLDWWPLQRTAGLAGSPGEHVSAHSSEPVPRRLAGNTVKSSKKRDTVVAATATATVSPARQAAVAASSPFPDGDVSARTVTWTRLVIEKLPLFALVAASAAVTYRAQLELSAVATLEKFPLPIRIENAFVSYVVYLWKTVWPSGLAVYYPHPIYDTRTGLKVPLEVFAGAFLLVGLLTAAAVVLRRRAPYLLAGWLWYVGTLVPVIGLIQVGSQAYADRYTYFPQIGILVAVCWGVADLARDRGRVAVAACAAAALALTVVTWQQLAVWKDSVALWRHSIDATFSTATSQLNLGTALEEAGDVPGAIKCYRAAIEYEPNNARMWVNMATGLYQLNQVNEAVKCLKVSLQLAPDVPQNISNLGRMEAARGNLEEAFKQFTRALDLKPDFAPAHLGLGTTLLATGHPDEALRHLKTAVELDPGSGQAHVLLGTFFEAQDNLEKAVPQYEEAVRLTPKEATHWFRLGVAYSRQNRADDARRCLERAVNLKPDTPEFRKALNGLRKSGK